MDSVSLQALRTSHKPSNAEVIVVSSDDEDVPVPRKHRVPNKVTRRTKRPPAETEEVVEISSDGESSLLKEIRKLKEVRYYAFSRSYP